MNFKFTTAQYFKCFSRPTSTLWVNMLPRGGGSSKKSAMGPKIIAVLPYIKQVLTDFLILKLFNNLKFFSSLTEIEANFK